MIILQLPYPPSANRLWTRTKRGMRRTTEYVRWMEEAGLRLINQQWEPITGPYRFSMDAVAPDKRARDIDNLIKPVNDCLQHFGVIENDSHCRHIKDVRWVNFGRGITVFIEPMEAGHAQ